MVSASEYARQRGVSRMAVSKAVAAGRISVTRDAAGRAWIDPDTANVEWAARTDPDQQQRGAHKEFERTEPMARKSAAKLARQAKPQRAGRMNSDAATFVEERTRLLRIRNAKAEIELATMRSELVDRESFTRAHAAKIRQASECFLALADRLAPVLAAETDPAVVHLLMRTEIRAAMQFVATTPPASAA